MIFELWDVVVVPFPFTDRSASKRRPALVISKKAFNKHGHTVLAMITSTAHTGWPGDTLLTNAQGAGLRQACTIRLKLFTLDSRLILRGIGHLQEADRQRVIGNIHAFLAT